MTSGKKELGARSLAIAECGIQSPERLPGYSMGYSSNHRPIKFSWVEISIRGNWDQRHRGPPTPHHEQHRRKEGKWKGTATQRDWEMPSDIGHVLRQSVLTLVTAHHGQEREKEKKRKDITRMAMLPRGSRYSTALVQCGTGTSLRSETSNTAWWKDVQDRARPTTYLRWRKASIKICFSTENLP